MWLSKTFIFGVISALCILPVVQGQSCGDGICIVGGSSSEISSCPQDCSPTCGDGVCAKSAYPAQYSETVTNCPKDCVATCGDGVCARVPINSSTAETATNCPKDCVPTCGDGVCSTAPLSGYTKETTSICSKDCSPICGDGVCATAPASGYSSESTANCPRDCTASCGDGVCAVVPASGVAETAVNCAKDCAPTCGDGVCSVAPLSSYQKEFYTTCPQDCNPVCGDGLCEGLENCLNCPKECGCRFNGGKVTLYQCAPNNITLSNCVNSTFSSTLPAFTNIASGVSYITVKYTSYLQPSSKYSGNFIFLINATNVGARLFINDKKLIDAYFPQDNIFTTAKALLPSDLIHKLDLEFYSMSASVPRNVNLMWRDLNDRSSTFTTINETYYSANQCGDHIFDAYETTTTCLSDFNACYLASCRNITDQCGDGICLEQLPQDCFVDCHQFLTAQCSTVAAKPGFLSQDLPVEADTLGDLIRNQMLWHLPGLEHIQYGVNIVTGEAAGAPVFYFGYCSENVGETIQDTYRGSLYTLPSEIYAQPAPKCQYSATATSFSSSIKMANSFAQQSGMEASGEAGGSWDDIGAKASFSYSQESSVKAARQMEQKESGSLILTELTCATSKVQMNKYTFHPSFLRDLSRVNTSDDILDMIDKYGTHFYQQAVLGGKLRQVTVVSKSFASSKTKTELEENAQRSFGASVTSPVFSVSGDYSDSIDTSVSASDQSSFEGASTHSTVITYGGPPGSFGPSSSEAPSNFGDWATSVDLLPVPIQYKLKKISEIIPSEWKTRNGTSLKTLWQQGEILWKERQIIYSEGLANKYSLYWFWRPDQITYPRAKNETFYFVLNDEVIALMEQNGPSGVYAPFSFYNDDIFQTKSPSKFDLYSQYNLEANGSFSFYSERADYEDNATEGTGDQPRQTVNHLDGSQLSMFSLHNWQTGTAILFDTFYIDSNVQQFKFLTRDLEALSIAKFYFELQSLGRNFSTSDLGTTFVEFTVYHTNGTRVYLDYLPNANILTTLSTPVSYAFDANYVTATARSDLSFPNSNQTAVSGIPYKIGLRLGSKPGTGTYGLNSTISLSLSNFWLQVNYCLDASLPSCFTDAPAHERTRRIFSMEPSKTVQIDLSSKTETVIPVAPLNYWL